MIRPDTALFTSAVLFLAGVSGCAEQNGEGNQVDIGNSQPTEQIAGSSVLSARLGQNSEFKIVETNSDVAMMLHGHEDDSEALKPIITQINQSQNFAEVYQIVTGNKSAPKNIQDLDTKYAGSNIVPKLPPPPERSAVSSGNLPSLTSTAQDLNAFVDTSEPAWDWVQDCSWFLNLAPSTCDERWKAVNVTWAWIQRESREHWGQLMAASHINGSDMKVEEWNGSAWTTVFSTYTEPRYYWTLWYGNRNASPKWRKFSNTGRGGNLARTHTHVGWNLPTGDVGQSCTYSYVCTTPQG